jgi:NAD(P)-dependent dehydrogenase (short-subunit alcohol dehydrogenase family)
LDILVNDVWGGDHLTQWVPFDQHNLEYGLELFRRGLFSHLITAHTCAPLLRKSSGSIIVEITDGIAERYRGSLYYDVVKHAVIRSAQGMAFELNDEGIAVVAVSPGFLRSEAMLDHFGVTENTWREAIDADPHFSESETPHFCARCIVALCSDANRMQYSGRALASWNLATHYGIVDVDGRQPHFGQYALRHLGIDLG